MMTNLPDSPDRVTTSTQIRNFLVVAVAIALSVVLFLGLRTQTQAVSLNALAARSTPLEVALTNGRPTLLEFYADWCTSCQSMAADVDQIQTQYSDRANFVMLNVDNTKWLPEILRYRVDGIPHFVFLNSQGTTIASAIGEQPRPILAANLDAMIAGQPLPYIQAGQTSAFKPTLAPKSGGDDPRSHGSQVKQ
jgi:thiol:disulfide interchange protein